MRRYVALSDWSRFQSVQSLAYSPQLHGSNHSRSFPSHLRGCLTLHGAFARALWLTHSFCENYDLFRHWSAAQVVVSQTHRTVSVVVIILRTESWFLEAAARAVAPFLRALVLAPRVWHGNASWHHPSSAIFELQALCKFTEVCPSLAQLGRGSRAKFRLLF
jgi:hypothetical protein